MNALTAAEVKRRGTAVIEERLRLGPMHLVKRSKPAAAVFTEEQYAQLTQQDSTGAAPPGLSAIRWLLRPPAAGRKSIARIARDRRAERKSWR